jgi:hypothetical protein
MIGKSGNRFSEKIMLKQRDEIIRLGTATSDAARSSFRRSAERARPQNEENRANPFAAIRCEWLSRSSIRLVEFRKCKGQRGLRYACRKVFSGIGNAKKPRIRW